MELSGPAACVCRESIRSVFGKNQLCGSFFAAEPPFCGRRDALASFCGATVANKTCMARSFRIASSWRALGSPSENMARPRVGLCPIGFILSSFGISTANLSLSPLGTAAEPPASAAGWMGCGMVRGSGASKLAGATAGD